MANDTADRLILIDLETTGLIPEDGLILEVGFRIVDLNLKTIGEWEATCWSDEYESFCTRENLGDFVWDMHIKSGLFTDAARHGDHPADVIAELTRWLNFHEVQPTEPLVGSSVQFDRAWLNCRMQEIEKRFSYRNIDISSIKELCRRYNPEIYLQLNEHTKKKELHRVIPDIDDSVNELKFYIQNFIFDAVSVMA